MKRHRDYFNSDNSDAFINNVTLNKKKRILNKINYSVNHDIKNNFPQFENNTSNVITQGTYNLHKVEIEFEDNQINFKCDCQQDKNNAFCKHSMSSISYLVSQYVKKATESLESSLKESVKKDLLMEINKSLSNLEIKN